jgi:hypothetical protein
LAGIIALGLILMLCARVFLRSPFFQIPLESDSQPAAARRGRHS